MNRGFLQKLIPALLDDETADEVIILILHDDSRAEIASGRKQRGRDDDEENHQAKLLRLLADEIESGSGMPLPGNNEMVGGEPL